MHRTEVPEPPTPEQQPNQIAQDQDQQEAQNPDDNLDVQPDEITSYYTLDALNQVKDFNHLNKIIGLVTDQHPEHYLDYHEEQQSMLMNPYDSPNQGNASSKVQGVTFDDRPSKDRSEEDDIEISLDVETQNNENHGPE